MDELLHHLLFSAYGVAFFWMAAVLWVHVWRLRALPAGWLFRWLAAFAMVHGGKEFIQQALWYLPVGPEAASHPFQHLAVLVNALSFTLLMQFGVEGMALGRPSWPAYRRYAPWLVLALWLAVHGVFVHDTGSSQPDEILLRYLIGLPASLLAARVLILQRGLPVTSGPEARRLRMAGWLVAGYGGLAIFGPVTAFFPANVIHHQAFLQWFGLPVATVRTLCAIGMTLLLGRTLEIFHNLEESQLMADIEHRTRQLVQSEERYRNLFRNAQEAIFLADEHGILLDANPAACRLMGTSHRQLVGQPITMLHPPTDRERHLAQFQELVRQGSGYFKDETLQRLDGGQVAVEVSASCVVYGQQRVVLGIFMDVSERRRIERELRLHRDHLDQMVQFRTDALMQANVILQTRQQELNQFACIVSASSDHISLIDRHYVYRVVNDAYLIHHGKKREEIIGHSVAELLGNEVFALIREKLDRCLAGEPVSFQDWFQFGASGRRWMDVRYNPYRNHQGEVTHLVVISRDATDRKNMEDALQHLERRFTLFMDHLPGVAFIKDADGRYLYANAGFRHLARCEQMDMAQWRDTVFWPPDYALLLAGNERMVQHTGHAHSFIEIYPRDDGEDYWLMHRFPIPAASGQTLGGIGVDITDRFRAEQQLRETAKFPDENPHAVLRVDRTGKVLYANRPGKALLVRWQCAVGEVLADPWRAAFEQALASGVMNRLEVDSGDRVLALTIVPFQDNGYVNLYGMDITELKTLLHTLHEKQQEMAELNRDLERRVAAEVESNRRKDFILMHQARLAAMGEMIGAIAHQWRQPLNALNILLANLEDAHQYGQLTATYLQQQVEKGNAIIYRMSTTVDDFRNFFKPDSVRQTFNPAVAVDEAINLLEANLANKGISLTFQRPGQSWTVHGYPNEYSQAILSILVNAKEAIQMRGVRPGQIELRIFQHENRLVTAIRDNGGGMAETVLPRIFEPYFTTKETSGGAGIGLYMARMIIEEHMGGRIVAFNQGEGAEFQVGLPVEESAHAP